MFEYIDTHAHLEMPDFNKDRDGVITQMQKENIGVITIGTDRKSSFQAVELAKKYENVFATVGFHPVDAGEEFVGSDFLELVKNKKVVAIGECGLDFFRLKGEFKIESEKTNLPAGRQEENFIRQIDFAVKNDLPIVVHCRDAHTEVIEILEEKRIIYGEKLKGVIHFFSGGIEEAKKYLDLGFYFSFGGVITFVNDYDEVLKFVPLERIMSETDAPFVAPVPYRGQRNNPLFIKEVVKKIAEIRENNLDKVKEILVQNATTAFSLINK